jgi:tRNA U34 5-methylaminomethyl-2-thiouridine-forming methyltransferase MnmC
MAHHARIERVTTEDGSTTLYDAALGAHYRSIWGARTESRAVFIDGARLPARPGPWRVIELGFGGATTFEQAVLAARNADITLHYHSVERAPLPPMLLADRTGEAGALARRALMQAGADGKGRVEVRSDDEQIILTLYLSDWSALPALRVEADAIFHDPFDPAINPESWTEQCFRWHAQHMRPDTVLATYGASGAARRAMQAAGLHVASLPGVGKKREISIAALTPAAIAHGKLLSDHTLRQ